MTKNIIIAKITSAHGVKGLVKLLSFCHHPEDIIKYSNKLFDNQNKSYKIEITSQLKGKSDNLFIAKIDGIDDRNQAELLRNKELFILRKDFKQENKDEFFYVDLIGLEVLDKQKNKLGKIVQIDDFGAGGIVEIAFDNKDKNESFSFTKEIFLEIDVDGGYVIVELPEFK